MLLNGFFKQKIFFQKKSMKQRNKIPSYKSFALISNQNCNGKLKLTHLLEYYPNKCR